MCCNINLVNSRYVWSGASPTGSRRCPGLTLALFVARGGRPPGKLAFSCFFFLLSKKRSLCVFKIKWPKIEEKQIYGVGSFQIMVPTPRHSKPRGDATEFSGHPSLDNPIFVTVAAYADPN